MRILLIGGTGFTGVSTIRYLQEAGHQVTIFHRGKTPAPFDCPEILGDHNQMTDFRQEFKRRNFDVVVDFITGSRPQAERLMDVFRGITGRLVVLSSMDVYRAMGLLRGTETGPLQPLPLTEESELRSRSHYTPEELSTLRGILRYFDTEYEKIDVEKVVLSNPELPGTILRLPMVYGPGDYIHRFHYVLKRMDDRRPFILYADDIAAWRTPRGFADNVGCAIALAATSDKAAERIYNICEEESFTELEWAKKIAGAVGWKGEFIVLPREKAPKHLLYPRRIEQHLVASSARIRTELGYREPISIEEGILRTIPWERENQPPAPLFMPFNYDDEDRAAQALKASA
ncbi:MAG: NAD-dependent epimerase/dehydratase family protein [Actinomycetota bacterium]